MIRVVYINLQSEFVLKMKDLNFSILMYNHYYINLLHKHGSEKTLDSLEL